MSAAALQSSREFPPGFVSDVRRATPLRQLVGRHVKLQKSGRQWKGCCPFHGEKTPSFYLYDGRPQSAHFHCFGCNAHGDAISFVMRQDGLDFRAAVQHLAAEAGLDVLTASRKRADPAQARALAERLQREQAEREAQAEAKHAADVADRIVRAQRIMGQTQDWNSTPGEAYWHTHRGIPEATADWSAALRWHAGEHALVAIATLPDGTPTACQLIKLTREGKNVVRPNGKKLKLTYGSRDSGAVVRLPGDPTKPLIIAEGPENGGSAAAATGSEAWIALGSIVRIEPPADRVVIVLSDGDQPGSQAAMQLSQWVAYWQRQGRRIVVATPTPKWPGHKCDFNDLIRQEGAAAVRERIDTAIASLVGVTLTAPPRPLPTGTLAATWDYNDRVMRELLAPTRDGELPRQILNATEGGGGKTDVVGRLLPEAIVTAKQQGRPHRAIIAVPEHKNLGRQLVKRLKKFGLTVAHWRGRGDPFNPQPDDLCQNPESVAAATIAGQDITKSCCGVGCLIYDRGLCEYLAQQAAVATADVVVIAHTQLKNHLSKQILEGVAWLIIDENCLGLFDRIYDLDVNTFGQPSLDEWPVVGDPDRTRVLGWTYEKLRAALAEIAKGRPIDAALYEAGLRSDEISAARKLEWRREVPADMVPSMPIETRRELAERARINYLLPRLAAFWDAAQSALTDGPDGAGRLDIVMRASRSGTHQEIVVHTQYHLASWAADLPTLLLNATGRLDDIRRIFPRAVERRADRIATPNASLVQILGGFSKGSVAGSARKQADLRAFLDVAYPNIAKGIVGHKSSIKTFEGMLNTLTTWHGANAGDDEQKGVSVHAVLDGPRPKSRDLTDLVAARTGRRIDDAAPVMATESVLMADGSGVAIPVLRYENPDVQAVYESIHHAAVSQALARPRQVLRTSASPVASLLFGNVAVDRPVDAIVRWADIRPDRLVHMVHGRRVTLNSADMAAWHPRLFKTEKAGSRARECFGRDPWGRVRAMVSRDPEPWSMVRYQPPGRGQHVHTWVVPTAEVQTLLLEATLRHGHLIYTDVSGFTPGRKTEGLPPVLDMVWMLQGMTSRPVPVLTAGPRPLTPNNAADQERPG